ncbi:MAG: BlaI/MecI/CopY family transcriptional regulator [Thermoanaerobaculia bacterium]
MTKLDKLEPLAPTELMLYGALCKLGQGTARDVFEYLEQRLDWNASDASSPRTIQTIMTLLQRLAAKKYLRAKRTSPPIPNIYTPIYAWETVFRRGLTRALEPYLLDREDLDLLLAFMFELPRPFERLATDSALQAQRQRDLYRRIRGTSREPDPFEKHWPDARFPGLEELRNAASPEPSEA